MTSLRNRNPVTVGLIGAAAMLMVGLLTFFWSDLPFVSGTEYTAEFGEAAGIKPNDEVRVAGVKVGEVTDVELDGDHVKVTFRAQGVWLGDQTVAVIRIKTLLGQKNLALDPLGTQPLDPDVPIPRSRTVTPYDVNDAFGDLAKTTGAIDTAQLATSFRTLSETFSKTSPEQVRAAFDGLSRLSTTISSRDQELRKLLGNTSSLGRTVADRNAQFESLISDGGVLLAEFAKRREAIASLLAGTRELAKQLGGVVADNQAQLGPALAQLERVTTVLQRNQDNLDRGLRLAGPFYRLIGNAVGNGRWIDTYVCGLVPSPNGCVPPKGAGR
ncbi:ABC transporter substrate-binding protein [Actinosynnema sp. ALI-1.44]|uniref:MCE family protein n=1 Tax=Actinosynnema sp. ALI-1.44 TaxID=1933779 RepID=UPI00097CC054|nr:MCE family protein [Actinosynnema sp. ALI-1.44]ONI84259.1 ABC transporter substrate-binding protein [Actinosynnema sp. ALI-1.44]